MADKEKALNALRDEQQRHNAELTEKARRIAAGYGDVNDMPRGRESWPDRLANACCLDYCLGGCILPLLTGLLLVNGWRLLSPLSSPPTAVAAGAASAFPLAPAAYASDEARWHDEPVVEPAYPEPIPFPPFITHQGEVSAPAPPSLMLDYWPLWACEHGAAPEVIAAIYSAELVTGVDAEPLVSMVFYESGFNINCHGDGGRSRGMCQIQRCWDDDYKRWTGEQFDPFDPWQAARCAAEILLHYGWAADDPAAQLKAFARYNGCRRGVNRYARKVAALTAELQGGMQ